MASGDGKIIKQDGGEEEIVKIKHTITKLYMRTCQSLQKALKRELGLNKVKQMICDQLAYYRSTFTL